MDHPSHMSHHGSAAFHGGVTRDEGNFVLQLTHLLLGRGWTSMESGLFPERFSGVPSPAGDPFVAWISWTRFQGAQFSYVHEDYP